MPDRSAINAPARTTRFEVQLELPGGAVSGWSTVELPSMTTETVEYREGSDPVYDYQLWGRTTYDDLTLERGAKQGEMQLWEWRKKVHQGKVDEARKDIAVIVYDAQGVNGAPLLRYEFKKAWPTEYQPPSLDATATGGDSAMATESLTCAFDKFERKAP